MARLQVGSPAKGIDAARHRQRCHSWVLDSAGESFYQVMDIHGLQCWSHLVIRSHLSSVMDHFCHIICHPIRPSNVHHGVMDTAVVDLGNEKQTTKLPAR